MRSVPAPLDVRIRSVLFQILRQCNYRCSHCSQDAPHIGRQTTAPVPQEMVRACLQEMKHLGLQRVRFTGGEPLLHPELPRIVFVAKTLGLDTSIVTNGALLCNRTEALVEAGIDFVWISLYGSSAAAYAAIAGRKPPAESLSEAVRVLALNTIKVGVYCTLQPGADKLGLSLLDKLVDQGATHIKFMQLMEQGRQIGADGHDPIEINKSILEQIRAYGERRPEVRISVSMRSGQLPTFIESGFRPQAELGCTAGSPDRWSISSDGEIQPCCLMMPLGRMETSAADGAALPLRFFSSSTRGPWQDPSGTDMCPALPLHAPKFPEQFICPLAYATI